MAGERFDVDYVTELAVAAAPFIDLTINVRGFRKYALTRSGTQRN